MRQKRFTAEEVANIILHDDADELRLLDNEIESQMEQLDENFLNNVAETIGLTNDNAENIDFENPSIEFAEYEAGPSPARKRERHRTPQNWKQNVQKKKRLLGQEYVGQTKIDGKQTLATKSARQMGPLCKKENCKISKKKHCNTFTQDDCQNIFQEYWSSANKAIQDMFVCSMVDVIQRKSPLVENSRRQHSRVYHLKKCGSSLEVCKEMFLSTLGISQKVVERIVIDNKENCGITAVVIKPRNPKPAKGFNWMEEDQIILKDFFNKIPKAPGHYCRKDSNKIYLTPLVPTLTKLYEIYQARCKALQKKSFSSFKFTEYLKDNNFSLFKRKKDMCNTCVAHREGNVTVEQFAAHQKLKTDALNLKEQDKISADNIEKFVITADTESLLTAPSNDAGVMFFHSKLNLHNFTFYDLKSREVLNFLWSEVNGEIEASNFTSCYITYLTRLVEEYPMLKTTILWSDGCGYQNKCKELSSALLTFCVQHGITIYHKYLEVGHTHMEVDSVHSNIERAAKHVNINLPSDYINVIRSARKRNPGKYNVEYLDFNFFKDYKFSCDIKSIKPCKEVGPPLVKDIRQLKYNPDGTIEFNLSYVEENWEKMPYKFKLRKLTQPQLYAAPLKISFIKWKHLQEIKQTIPSECHYFYDNLDHYPKLNGSNAAEDTI